MKNIYVTVKETKRITKEYTVTDDIYEEIQRIECIPDDMLKDLRNDINLHPEEVDIDYVVTDEDDNIIIDWVD